MLQLEQDGLGHREQVSAQRDKFMLDSNHGAAFLVSRRPDANGFIRADSDSLLFRDASDLLRSRLEAVLPGMAAASEKGYEVRWSAVDSSNIERMFDAVRSVVRR
jgi:hypothetical protein